MAIDVDKAKALLKQMDDAKAELKRMGGVKQMREYVALAASAERMKEIEAEIAAKDEPEE